MTSNGSNRYALPASGAGKKTPLAPVRSTHQHSASAVSSASGAGRKTPLAPVRSTHQHSASAVSSASGAGKKTPLAPVRSTPQHSSNAKRSEGDRGSTSTIRTAASSLPLKPSSSSRSGSTCCDICMNEKKNHQLFKTKSCRHPFCTQCVAQYVITKIEQNSAKVNCPKPNCKMFIEHGDCRGIISKEWSDKWEALTYESLIPASQKFYCPFKECSALLIDDTGNVTASECPICHRLFCAQCKVPWHQDMSCARFLSSLDPKDERGKEKMVYDLAKKKKWKRCPKCMYYVEKSEGCDHIKCRCKYEFCYRCGKRWGYIHRCIPTPE